MSNVNCIYVCVNENWLFYSSQMSFKFIYSFPHVRRRFFFSSSSGRHFYTRTYEYIFSIWKKVSNDEALLEETLIDPASIISYWMSQLSNVDNAMHQFNILKTFKQINFLKNNIEKFDIFICTIKFPSKYLISFEFYKVLMME